MYFRWSGEGLNPLCSKLGDFLWLPVHNKQEVNKILFQVRGNSRIESCHQGNSSQWDCSPQILFRRHNRKWAEPYHWQLWLVQKFWEIDLPHDFQSRTQQEVSRTPPLTVVTGAEVLGECPPPDFQSRTQQEVRKFSQWAGPPPLKVGNGAEVFSGEISPQFLSRPNRKWERVLWV